MPISKVENIDCMEGMKTFEDKFFDLAIVDPPYGKKDIACGFGNGSDRVRNTVTKQRRGWDKPSTQYFSELFRVSKNQIIWGGNYFIEYLYSTNCFIVWDKQTGNNPYADVELAWTSFNSVSKRFLKFWLGAHIHKVEKIIHINQKPVVLYKWLLKNYAQEGDKILDIHMGSQSSRIAAFDRGFDYWGYELDKEYFEAGNKRFKEQTMQQQLFP